MAISLPPHRFHQPSLLDRPIFLPARLSHERILPHQGRKMARSATTRGEQDGYGEPQVEVGPSYRERRRSQVLAAVLLQHCDQYFQCCIDHVWAFDNQRLGL